MTVVETTPVTVTRERLKCLCGGEMLFAGTMRCTSPGQYMHRCGTCGAVEWVTGKSYPRTVGAFPEFADE